ncbi:phosphatase PAP2 family protein [Glutamicibacter protophormiae]|uniref:phosphatase PAP2 family protein n=1 Tax=Glutamicibacter protophormiae TaxID=37930 RepID=UPI002A7FD86C|nr:phosphatase PAP2 family protein [Glutamicibacter protophormiae]WPR63263.1 phosphatase PAP2 family protein [Glutamicibacter protophormiae]WPR66759.1 phosphatase PAP2 family protein [Glutamicibacter protophormiae]
MTPESVRAASMRPVLPVLIALGLMTLSLPAFVVRKQLFTAITAAADSSPALTLLAVFFADTALLLLVLFTAGLAVWSWFKDRAALTRLVLGGVGVLLAYAASSTLKLVFTEARPCQSIHMALAETCPPPGDWSWPSNHSVLAAAFAAACALAVVRLRWYLAAVALLIAAARVGVGAHYLHDVLFGLGLGLLVVLATVHLLPRLRRVLPSSVPWVRQAGRR